MPNVVSSIIPEKAQTSTGNQEKAETSRKFPENNRGVGETKTISVTDW
jgi:hypothetical protein